MFSDDFNLRELKVKEAHPCSPHLFKRKISVEFLANTKAGKAVKGPFYWYIPRRLWLYSEISTLVSSPVTY
jgi:hypothetical protein